MAKKSKKLKNEGPDFNQIAEMVTNTMIKNGMTMEDLINAIEEMRGSSLPDMLNKYYSYQKPDYAKIVEPLHPALDALIHYKGFEGVTDTMLGTLARLKQEEPDAAAKALINALYYILAHQQELMAEGYTCIPLYAILHIMIELGVKGATPVLIEILSQDAYFTEFYFAAFQEDLSFAISQLCKDGLKALEDFMYAVGRIPYTKCIVADGVIHMALTDPMLRIGVIAWFARVLKRYSEILVFETNIDYITHSLAQLRAKELRPLIQHLYQIKDVPFIVISGEEELQYLLDFGTDERKIEITSLADVIRKVEEAYVEDSFDYDPFGYLDDDGYGDDEYNDDDDSELLIDYKDDGLLYRLEISLDDCDPEVTRELIVPSNIRLYWLGRVLMTVMGWEGYHLDQFIKGRDTYANPDDEFGFNERDYHKYALNDILKRKGAKMQWEYDFGDSWMHTIRLAEKIKSKGQPVIEATKAVNACPPEDCGGVWGYAEMLDALADKTHPEHESWSEWIGPKFNPKKVSLKSINSKLKHFKADL